MQSTAPFFAGIADAPPPQRVIWTQAADGARLRLALWPEGPKGMVAIFPGRTEVIEKYGRVISDLTQAGYGAAAIDWRGQGLSDRLPATPLLGDVADFALYQQDVAAYCAALDEHAPDAARFVLAHSMGGCIALRALTQGFGGRAVSFSAPMWGLPLTGATRRAIGVLRSALRLTRLDMREIPGAGIEFRLWENPFDTNELTADFDTYHWMQAQVQAQPELRLGAPSLRWVAAALAEIAALKLAPSPDIPAFCGLGTREMLVSPQAIEARMADWPQGRLEIFDGALHELLMERPATRDAFLRATIELFDAHQP
ncbi:lysophospholipase [Roseinatronobacter thiooxidans]|uniref:Lysophospholipase n=1 Tax=Roseinatronobacter thiooxidans TaxID=121821 RepID=A0A2W7QUF2_9RHOB|nr:alpha/beta hydrolase [Roseinatronobacter thiooxidans]PZX47327.1 lysophospholipase [Roseinatronobacter thiooxidans]